MTRRLSPHSIRIKKRIIGPGQPCYIIAEAGVNHNGSLERALRLVDAAKQSGADCVKFQTFRAADLVTARAPKALYQLEHTNKHDSQLAMLEKLELPYDAFATIQAHCKRRKIQFLSTPYGFEDVDFLDRLGVSAFKIASGQLVEPLFLEHVAKKRKPIILSTGMSTFEEVNEAVRALRSIRPSKLVLLQCTTNYPSRDEDAHLRAMVTMGERLNVLVGYSDHTVGPWAAAASAALGACIVEKHFTLDKHMRGPDHSASMNPQELAEMIQGIRTVENALGSAKKFPSPIELQNAKAMRRSLATTEFIPRSTVLKTSMLTFKRPGTGIPPKAISEVIGRMVRRDVPADTLLPNATVFSGKRLR